MFKLYYFQKRDSGQGLVEFALTFWMYLLITFFIIDFGWVAFQRVSFEYGYSHASWSVSAADVGDEDNLEEAGCENTYAGATVSTPLYDRLTSCSPGIIDGNLGIANAHAKLYNEAVTYSVPDTFGNPVPAISITRYMNLNADFSYVIHPLTPIGSMVFGDDIRVDKTLTRTRIVRTQQRSG